MMCDQFYATSWIDVYHDGWPIYFQWKPPDDVGLVEFGRDGQRRFHKRSDLAAKRRAQKIAKQEADLREKCRSVVRQCPGLIHVFFNPGLFYGWWIYIWTIRDSISLNFRRYTEYPEVIEQAMELYPCGVLPRREYFDIWARQFCKQFPNPHRRARKEGLGLCRVFFDKDGRLERIGSCQEVLNG